MQYNDDTRCHNFKIASQKLISYSPEIKKYSKEFTTNENGVKSLELEWDSYDITTDFSYKVDYQIGGIIPSSVINVLPDTEQEVTVVLVDFYDNSFLITVKDYGTEAPLDEAEVTLNGSGALKGKYGETKVTGLGNFLQDDWSGGPGQEDYDDETRYFSDNGNLNVSGTPGQVSLKKETQNIPFTETFGTIFYRDDGITTADWNTSEGEVRLKKLGEASGLPPGVFFDNNPKVKLAALDEPPALPPSETYENEGIAQTKKLNSVEGKITKATLSVNEVLNGQSIEYYVSANGGQNFESIIPDVELDLIRQGSDLRFKAVLSTIDTSKTPILKEITINYTIESYVTSGELISSTYETGDDSEYIKINWTPLFQPLEAGTVSIKFQIATADVMPEGIAGWKFLGPDGQEDTYYTTPGMSIFNEHNGDRFIRYKMILVTENQAYSPVIGSTGIDYTIGCIPPGQVFFNDLEAGVYYIEVNKSGYEIHNDNIDVSGNMRRDIFLISI